MSLLRDICMKVGIKINVRENKEFILENEINKI